MAENRYEENTCEYIAPKKTINDKKQCNDWQSIKRELFNKMWTKIDKKIAKLRTESHTKLKQSVIKCFENHSSKQFKQTLFKYNKYSNYGLIPTAIINLGSNTSEHKFFYDLLSENFDDISSTPFIYLSPADCSSISSTVSVISDFIITDEIKQSLNLKDSQLKNFTFGMIINAYKEYTIKLYKNDRCLSPLVFFVSNIDSFDNLVLSHLITILKEYTETLPIMVVMSASNSWTSLQHMLPSHATDCLEIHFFNCVSAYQTIDKLFDNAIIHYKIAFNLTPKVLSFIYDSHTYFDYSVENVRNLLKYALFEHYYSNPLSILCQPIDDLEKFIKKLSDTDLNLFRNNNNVINELIESSNSKQFKKKLFESIENFQAINTEFVKQIKILFLLLNEIDKRFSSFPYLYICALSKSDELSETIYSLNSISQTKWKLSLENCLSNSAICDDSLCLVKTLKLCLNDLNKLETEPTEVAEKLDISQIKEKLSATKSRQQLRNQLKPKKTFSKFDVWKQNTLSFIENTLSALKNPLDNPLHQIFYFDDLKLLKEHTICSPRDEIKNVLSDPSILLKTDKIDNSKNDFFSMYTLFQENAMIINMCECFESFKSFNEELTNLPTPSKRKKQTIKNSVEDSDKKIMARFLNVVSDFEYIGLLEPAKRKTDHLLKLVWF